MNGILGRDKLWNQQIWSDIDNAVRDEVGRIRVAQKVFPCTLLPNWQYVPNDQLPTMVTNILKIEEGQTKPFVEIWVEFSLTQSQVDSEENLHTGRTLARMAANKIAAAEDTLLFRGKAKAVTALTTMSGTPPLVQEMNANSLGDGFLGAHPANVRVARPTTAKPDDLVEKVADGIANLRKKQHYGPYALFLPAKQFAHASAPLPRTTVTPADRIIPLVTGGLVGTGCLDDNEGLLVSLGGELTTIYIGIDTTTAFTHIESNGIYRFRVFERLQFVGRDSTVFQPFEFL